MFVNYFNYYTIMFTLYHIEKCYLNSIKTKHYIYIKKKIQYTCMYFIKMYVVFYNYNRDTMGY